MRRVPPPTNGAATTAPSSAPSARLRPRRCSISTKPKRELAPAPLPRHRTPPAAARRGRQKRFTARLLDRVAPAEVQGVDPSAAQLAFARERHAGRAQFHQGDAMALPFPARRFDAAVMALVIFFVPEPAKGLSEMVRVVAPGGIVAAYAWDMMGGGYPGEPIRAEMKALGVELPSPPSPGASRLEAPRQLWTGAGLDAVEMREIPVSRSFSDFDAFWSISLLAATIGPTVAAMPAGDAARLKE